MGAYKKEAVMTVGFFVAYLLMAHTAPWAILLGIDDSVRMFGYPVHYFIAIFLGWFGVLAVSIAWNICADRLEEEIERENDAATADKRCSGSAMTGHAERDTQDSSTGRAQ